MKFVFAIISAVFALAAGVYFLDVLTVESSRNATVFQQIVARVSFGFAALICIVSAGFAAVVSRLDAVAGLRGTINDIALSNADAAKSVDGLLKHAEAPARLAAAARQEAASAADRERLSAYRDELQGTFGSTAPPVSGGRLAVEAAMLDATRKPSNA